MEYLYFLFRGKKVTAEVKGRIYIVRFSSNTDYRIYGEDQKSVSKEERELLMTVLKSEHESLIRGLERMYRSFMEFDRQFDIKAFQKPDPQLKTKIRNLFNREYTDGVNVFVAP